MTLHSPRYAINLTFLGLVSKLATFAIPASNHARELANQISFTRKTSLQVQDIWKHGKFLKWLLSLLDQTFFKKTRIQTKAFKNINHSGLPPAGQFEWPKFISLQTEAAHFAETMMTTVNEVKNDITKVSNKSVNIKYGLRTTDYGLRTTDWV